MLKTTCLCVAAASALLHTPRHPQHRRISLQSLATDAEISLLAGDEYAMDISSITPDSERETYIGQGSGVNEGTGIGALGNRLKAWVGRLLARKNKPIYDELWTIIHDDLLAACEARAGVRPAPTWFSSDKAPHAFATDDGACAGEVAAYSGGPIDWVTTCKFFSSTLGFGNMRIDGWLDRSSRAPHLAVHLCIVFNVLFIYVTLVPRTNLVLDDAYNDFIYGDPKASLGDRSLNDIHNDCIDARDFKAYHSKSHVVKAFMTAPTTLLYTVKHNKKNFELIREISKNYTNYWLDLALGEVDDPGGVLSKGVTTDVVQRELLQTDVRTRQFCGRDPDTKNVANIFGLELTDKLVRTLWGSPEDPVWASR
mmetsp:Transcript_28007/g.86633  ORF Transcript_28007/g.86633 Transcript_28007/m.86633 type:complete len:368 (+) Transcript_28007:875-1978(+)